MSPAALEAGGAFPKPQLPSRMKVTGRARARFVPAAGCRSRDRLTTASRSKSDSTESAVRRACGLDVCAGTERTLRGHCPERLKQCSTFRGGWAELEHSGIVTLQPAPGVGDARPD